MRPLVLRRVFHGRGLGVRGVGDRPAPVTERRYDALEGTPWWVRAAVYVGVPTAAFVVLLWFLLTQYIVVLDKLVVNDGIMIENQRMIIQHQVDMTHLLREHEQSTALLQRIVLCVSLAQTDSERARCFQER